MAAAGTATPSSAASDVTTRRRQPSADGGWGAELARYEHHKRHEIDPGLVGGAPIRMDMKQVKLQERAWDSLLQRYRDEGKEQHQRQREEEHRDAHLNRAKDIQVLRELHYNVINHRSHLDPISVREVEQHGDANNASFPVTAVDYNIISNLGYNEHHWAPPDRRPPAPKRSAKQREAPAHQIKDFNIVTNRYKGNHETKTERDEALILLESTAKYDKCCAFNPVTQQFTNARREERARSCDDARDVEVAMRAEGMIPPSARARPTAFYDAVTHEVHNPDMLRLVDSADGERTARYAARHGIENKRRAADVHLEDLCAKQKHENIAHARFEESTGRGYDVITNRAYGDGNKTQALHKPATTPRPTPWEKAQLNRDDAPQAAPAPAADRTRRQPSSRRHVSTPRAAPLAEAGGRLFGVNDVTRRMPMPPPAPAVPGSPSGFSTYSRPTPRGPAGY